MNNLLINNYNDAILALKKNGLLFRYLTSSLKKDKMLALLAVNQNGLALEYLKDQELHNDKMVTLSAVNQNGLALQFVYEAFKDNFDIVMAAVKQNGQSLEYASYYLKNNRKIVLEAIKHNLKPNSVHLQSELFFSKDFMLQVVAINGENIEYASPEFRDDKDIIITAIQNSNTDKAFRLASERLQNDEDVVKLAINKNCLNILSANKRFWYKKEYVLLAIEHNGYLLKWLEDFKHDREVVELAVKNNGLALEFADEKLKKDFDIVKTAITQNAIAWVYVDPELQKNNEILSLINEEQWKNIWQYCDNQDIQSLDNSVLIYLGIDNVKQSLNEIRKIYPFKFEKFKTRKQVNNINLEKLNNEPTLNIIDNLLENDAGLDYYI